jgi:hypothetical protein
LGGQILEAEYTRARYTNGRGTDRAPPEGNKWLSEVKLDGYRALLIKDGARVKIRWPMLAVAAGDRPYCTRSTE